MLPERLFGIIGYPLGHTLSPRIHNWGFERFGLPAVYLAWPVTPDKLPGFVAAARLLGIAGVSVTIPHKTAIMPMLDGLTELARKVGAVNTLFWKDNELWGDNTDVAGFTRPLRERETLPDSALVLGCGGAARAVVAGLLSLGLGRVSVTNRTPEKAEPLLRDFPVAFVPWEERNSVPAGLIVNSTPIGMTGAYEGLSPWPRYDFGPGRIAYDLVYSPRRTRFLADAEAAGAEVVSGLEMLLWQGVEQFRLWTGRDLPAKEARELLVASLYGSRGTNGER